MLKGVEKVKFDTKTIAINALIACMYAVFTLAIAPLAYLEIQFRLSEIIVFLAFYNKKFITGLVVGCFLANIPSTLGWYDMVFGTFSTLIVCMMMYKISNKYVAAIIGAIITGVIIGYELSLAFGIPFFINAIYVALGEGAVLLIGAYLFDKLMRNQKISEYIKE